MYATKKYRFQYKNATRFERLAFHSADEASISALCLITNEMEMRMMIGDAALADYRSVEGCVRWQQC